MLENSVLLKVQILWNSKQINQKLLQIQSRVGQRIDVPNLSFSSNVINKRMEQGKPLIGFDELVLDWSLLRDTFVKVTAVFAEYPDLFGPIPKELVEAGAKRFPTKKVVKAWFRGSKLPPTTVTNNISEALLNNLIHASLRPFLVNYSTALLSLVNQENWRRGYCPICGGYPDLAFLDTERGARWLVCSRCDAEWLFQRLECPYCGSKDQDALAYFTDDEGLYRLYVCEQCKRYLKAVDLRQAKSEVLLPLERLLTLDIDAQAKEYGYGHGDAAGNRVKKNADSKKHTG